MQLGQGQTSSPGPTFAISAKADPKYCRHCFPEFEIPHIDTLNARRTGEWYPFTDAVYGHRWQVHANKAEVKFCAEREAGAAFLRAMKANSVGVDALLPGA